MSNYDLFILDYNKTCDTFCSSTIRCGSCNGLEREMSVDQRPRLGNRNVWDFNNNNDDKKN